MQRMLDAGPDTVQPAAGDRRHVSEAGMAASIGRPGRSARPQLHAFSPLAFWNAAPRATGIDPAGIYTNTNTPLRVIFGLRKKLW